MKISAALKPCPFCGSEPEHYPDGAEEGYSLMCTGDDCPLNTFGYSTEEEAENAWNHRANESNAESTQAVAWRHDNGPFAGMALTRSKNVADSWIANGWNVTPLYTAQPALTLPDGFKLVPTVPTPEMIAAAMNCDDVTFNADETFCVNFDSIYRAMLKAAPSDTNAMNNSNGGEQKKPSKEARILAFAVLRCAKKTSIENAILELKELCYTAQELQKQHHILESFDLPLTRSPNLNGEETHTPEQIPQDRSKL
ncbi:Lar family restriction alleviation protein [Serratia ureilytica]|uniref:Lar family restriction alleviation protein n=1 Tax=Serratia ureilytica TaxID=300181 RepID=UPI002360E0C9|nr:Lar family restriction alleviation protein [Serratia ureilytica]